MMTGGSLVDDVVGLGQELLHRAVGEGTQGEHDVGLSCRSAESFFAKSDADKCALFEMVSGGVVTVEAVEGLDDFGNSQSWIETLFGSRGMGVASSEAVDDPGRGCSESVVVKDNSAQREPRQIVEAVDGFDVVLLQYPCVDDFLRTRSSLFFGLEDKDDVNAVE